MLQMPYFDSTSEEDDALCSTPSSSQPSISYLAPPRPINMVRSHSTSSLHDLVHDLRRKQMQVHKNDNSNKYSNNGGLASQLLKKVKRISIVFQPHHHHHHHHQEKQKQPSSPPTSNTTTTAEIRRADSTVLLAHTTPPPIQPLSAVIEETDQLQLAADRQDRWVQNGIRLHEKGQFEKATHEFRRAASEGSPMGMLFYGMSLRHGWGCRRDERLGFKYLQRSAELNLLDLEHEQQFSSSKDSLIQKVKSRELRVAIYELGVSLSYGWGCAKDKRMAVYLFEMAAYLGDPDALIDAAQCNHYGYGVAKNLRLAAKYYRMAEKQGRGIVGNSWIYKSKYT